MNKPKSNLENTKFYLKHSYDNLITSDDLLTEVFFNRKLMNFVTATFYGKLIVWKLTEEAVLVHEFNKNERPITSMAQHPHESNYFIAAGLDSEIRIYDLDQFIHIYSFELPNEFSLRMITMLNGHSFACQYENGEVNSGHLYNIAHLFLTRNQNVKQIGKLFTNKSLTSPTYVFSMFADNSIQIQDPNNKKLDVVSTIYPPPMTQEVLQVVHCRCRNEFIMLMNNGSLYVYKVTNVTGTLIQIVKKSQIKDARGFPIS